MASSESESEGDEIPRTDLCEVCRLEIVPELVHLEGQHDLIHQARQAEEGFMPVTGGQATVRYSCQCSHVDVEFGPGSASAWDVPDEWMWDEDAQNPRAVDLFDSDSTSEYVTRWRALRDRIQYEHDERQRLPVDGQVTYPIHIRPEEVGEV